MLAVPRSVAMKITGHKTESVYRRYAIVDMAQLREATRRMEQRAEAGWPVAERHEKASGNIQTTFKQGREQRFGPSAGS